CVFKHKMLLDEKIGDGNLMSHLNDFKVRVIGVKYDLEENWMFATPARKAREGETRLSVPMVMREETIPKNEEERKVTASVQGGKAFEITIEKLSTRPMILYQEEPIYTQEARDKKIEGVVVLSVVFGADAQLRDIEVVKGLPYGLTEKALEAAKK